MPVVDNIVALPMTELFPLLHCFWPFCDINPIGDANIFPVFPSVLFPPDPVSSSQILAQVLFPAFKTIDELIDTFLIQVWFAFSFESPRDEVRRPAAFQEPDDFLLKRRLFDRISYLASLCFPLARLSLRGVRKVLPEFQMLVPFEF